MTDTTDTTGTQGELDGLSPDMPNAKKSRSMKRVFAEHPRVWREYDYVYPVVSRRSQGVSIGVNLNPDKVCNFACLYCCVNRQIEPTVKTVDLVKLREELAGMIYFVQSGAIWKDLKFSGVDKTYRRLNDIAFSGNGEPTACPVFQEAVKLTCDLRKELQLDDVKLVLITNATLLNREKVQIGLQHFKVDLDQLWLKLDAGTQAYYELVEQTRVPLSHVLSNILAIGKQRPVVLQSLFMQIDNMPVSEVEFAAYCEQVAKLVQDGCQIDHVQLYTVARQTASDRVSSLSCKQIDALANHFKEKLPSIRLQIYYGVD